MQAGFTYPLTHLPNYSTTKSEAVQVCVRARL